jgi:hypothetical protein
VIPEGITSKVSGPPLSAIKNEVARYHVTVATTSPGATEIMTTAWVQLMTDESSSDQLALTSSETHHVAFEEGQTDSFTFEIAHLGEIKKIRIGHNGGGFGSGWHVDNVTVTEMETLRCWLFKIDLTIQHSVVDAGWREGKAVVLEPGGRTIDVPEEAFTIAGVACHDDLHPANTSLVSLPDKVLVGE